MRISIKSRSPRSTLQVYLTTTKMLYWNGKGRYGRIGKILWKALVPQEGPANTVQGELLRSVGRLADELYRNGNRNWGPLFREMIAALRAELLNPASRNYTQVRRDIDRLEEFGEEPQLIEYQDGEDEIDRLTEAV